MQSQNLQTKGCNHVLNSYEKGGGTNGHFCQGLRNLNDLFKY